MDFSTKDVDRLITPGREPLKGLSKLCLVRMKRAVKLDGGNLANKARRQQQNPGPPEQPRPKPCAL